MYVQNVLLKLKSASAGAFSHPVQLIGFVAAAVVTPFMLLTFGGVGSNNLPWYFWAPIPLLLLAVVSVGFSMFVHNSHAAEGISIRPRHD
jgi:hypothetical protein